MRPGRSFLRVFLAAACDSDAGPRRLAHAADVLRRLDQGERRYGDRYLERNNVREALEEVWDLTAYLVLEFDRLGCKGHGHEPVAELLLAAAIMAADVDDLLRQALERLERVGH